MGAHARIEGQSGFVLHSYPYKETSLLVEAFTATYGRVALVARGAKRPRSELRGLLQAFQPLALGWTGRGEVKSLIAADWRGGLPLPHGPALLCAFYLNELLLKLLPRDDPHPQLYADYEAALVGLAGIDDQPSVLRRFELRLLAEVGYGLELAHDIETGDPIVAEARYHYRIDRGPVRFDAGSASGDDRRSDAAPEPPLVQGATLLALVAGRFPDARSAGEAKLLMRRAIDHHLEQRSLFSRRLIRDLQALESLPAEES